MRPDESPVVLGNSTSLAGQQYKTHSSPARFVRLSDKPTRILLRRGVNQVAASNAKGAAEAAKVAQEVAEMAFEAAESGDAEVGAEAADKALKVRAGFFVHQRLTRSRVSFLHH